MQSVKHKRSALLVNGGPKLPTISQLEVGEIAINFAEGHETLSTRNNNDGIATFSSDATLDKKYIASGAVVSAMSEIAKTIEDDEFVIAQAFNSQNDRLELLESVDTFTRDDYYDKWESDGRYLSTATTIPTEASIENSGFTKNRGNAKIFYGTCTGDPGYINKTVICPEFTSEDLVKGALVFVTFSNTNTADTEAIKLGVNGTGYKPIRVQYAESNSVSYLRYEKALYGNCTYLFGYDGANWLLLTTDSDRDTVPSIITQAEAEAGTSTLQRIISPMSLKRDIEYRMAQNQPDWSETATTSPSFIKNKPSLSSYFDDVEYDSTTKRINFKNNNSVIDYVDATDFIKDGMVSSVTVSNGNLVVSFNTEAGREDIELALTQIFNPSNYYDKTTADGKFLTGFTETDPTVPAWAKQANKPTYTATEVGALPDTIDVPTEDSIEASGFTKNALTAFTETDPTVPSWAKASTKPTYTANEVGALPTGTTLDNIADGSTRKLSNYSLTSHTHSQYSQTGHTHSEYSLTSHTHSNYSLTSHTHSDYATTGNVNTLSSSTHTHVNNSALHLPSVSASDNGKILQVVNGQWTLVTPTVIYTGNGTPDNTLGNNGDIYLQTS